jgi:hypothetical protein
MNSIYVPWPEPRRRQLLSTPYHRRAPPRLASPLCAAPPSPAAAAPPHTEQPPALATAPLRPLLPFASPPPHRTPYQPAPRPLEPPPEARWKRTREREEWRGEQAARVTG